MPTLNQVSRDLRTAAAIPARCGLRLTDSGHGTLVEASKTPVIASGGVKEAADIRKLKPIGVAGVIVGRSLYEGTLTLKDALGAAR